MSFLLKIKEIHIEYFNFNQNFSSDNFIFFQDSVETFYMNYCTFTNFNEIKFNMKNVEYFKLSGCGISKINTDQVENMPAVEYLDLQNNNLTSIDFIGNQHSN